MCMDEFIKKLYDFRGIYRIFWSQNSHWIVKKNHCDLILTIGFDLSQNSRYLPIFTDILLIFTDISPIFTDISMILSIFHLFFPQPIISCQYLFGVGR